MKLPSFKQVLLPLSATVLSIAAVATAEFEAPVVAPTPTPIQTEVPSPVVSPTSTPAASVSPTPTPGLTVTPAYTRFTGSRFSYEEPSGAEHGPGNSEGSFSFNGVAYSISIIPVITRPGTSVETIEEYLTKGGTEPATLDGMTKITVAGLDAYRDTKFMTTRLLREKTVYVIQARNLSDPTYPARSSSDPVYSRLLSTLSID